MDELTQLRALLDTPWELGESGKALLLADGTRRTWRTVAGGAPHHDGALELLDIAPESVAAYLIIAPDGEAQIWPVDEVPGAEQMVEQLLADDQRIHRAQDEGEWDFAGTPAA